MQIFISGKEVLTVQDAARLADVSTRWISHLVETGKLRAVRHEKRRFIYKESLDEYIKDRDSNKI